LIHAKELDSQSLRILQAYCKENDLELFSREDFYEEAICPTLRMGGAITGFNLGFDISRITAPHKSYTCHRDNSGFTFHLAEYQSKSGEWKASVCRPGIERTSIDSKKAFYRIGYLKLKKKGERFGLSQMEIDEYRKGRFLDVRTLAAALTNRSYSLASLCHALKAPLEFQKLEYVEGTITPKKIRYCRRDVKATVWCLNELKKEFDKHTSIELRPDQAFSAVSIAKSYYDAMGIVPPAKKFELPDAVSAITYESFYAGRSEIKIRRVEVPVTLCDFQSCYATVNALLNNWQILTAESLEFQECTQEIQQWLQELTFSKLFDQRTWPQLRFFAKVRPNGDVLPVRARYDGESQNIAFNHFSSSESYAYAGPALAAAAILGSKVPEIE